MRKAKRSLSHLSVDQLADALRTLIDQGRIKAQDVGAALQRRQKLIDDYRQKLAALLGEAGPVRGRRARRKAAPGRRAAAKVSRPSRKRAKPRISAGTRKVYQAQGRYMAALRPLSKRDRAKVKALRKKSGVDAAVALAKKMAPQATAS